MVHGAALRLDKWLWFARLAKTRSAAQHLAESRRLRIDGRVIDRASALVRAGSVVSFPRDDQVIVIKVEGLSDRRGPYEDARHLYTDLTRKLTSGALPPSTRTVDAGGGGVLAGAL